LAPSQDVDPASEPALIRTVSAMHQAADAYREAGLRIGLVPTMGYLHEGHLSLIRQAGRMADRVVVSLFVNPIQFGPREDLDRYPRDFERDLALVRDAHGHAIYAPTPGEMYPEGYATYVEVERLTDHLCGPARPGHFRGVATVVAKLFCAVKPHVAVFGQKDGQQAGVIRRMTRDMNLDVEIAIAPTVREEDGLAMSSRNVNLDPDQRRQAPALYQALREAASLIAEGERRAGAVTDLLKDRIGSRPGAAVEYAEVVGTEEYAPLAVLSGTVMLAVAVRFGATRLIDNLVVDCRE
jgi:pantoate--beta-alanine ligase